MAATLVSQLADLFSYYFVDPLSRVVWEEEDHTTSKNPQILGLAFYTQDMVEW